MADKAVEDGVLKHVSPSQITTYRRCARKWYYDKVARLPVESTCQQNAGTSIHAELESYFSGGEPPTNRGAQVALKFLPAQDAGFMAEMELEDPELYIDQVRVKGFIDLVGSTNGDIVEIYDYKTCSSWRYCKTEAQLREDVQQGVYAKWALAKYPAATGVRVALIYIRRDNGKVRVVSADLTKREIDNTWSGVVETVTYMKRTAESSEHDVERNFDACSDFGGCPYFGDCRTLAERLDMYVDE